MTRLEALKDLKAKVEAGEWFSGIAQHAISTPQEAYYHALGAYDGSLDAAKALRIALGLPVPDKMHSDARLELLGVLGEVIAREEQT
jgi:hypothetical protein